MANDFKAKQIRTTQVIASGSNSSNAAILLYGSSSATNSSGGYSATMTSAVGSDVFLFVSGSTSSRNTKNSKGTTLVGGDLAASGSIFTPVEVRGSAFIMGGGSAYLSSSAGSDAILAAGSNIVIDSDINTTIRPGQNLDILLPYFNGSTYSVKYEDSGPAYYNAFSIEPGGGEEPKVKIGDQSAYGLNATLDVLGRITAASFITASLGLSGSLTRLSDNRSYLVAGSNVTIVSESNGQVRISSTGGGGSPGGSDTYVQFNQGGTTFAGDAGLTYDYNNSRLYADNLTITADALFQGAVDVASGIATTQSTFSLVDTTATTVTFAKAATSLDMGISTGVTVISGSVRAPNGVSGSLTRLTDGRSYLVAGSNVTITSASNGQVTISSTGGGGSSRSLFTDPSNSQINATGSLALAGDLGTSYVSTNAGTGVYLFVSGNIGTTSAKSNKIALFGGDVVTSGSIFVEDASGFTQINQNGGNLSIRNRSLAGQLVASVNTSIGNTVNFLDVRPNGMAVNTKVAILPSVFAGPANPFNSTDTSFFIGGSPNTKDGSSGGTSVVGGDFLVSGSTYIGNSSANTLYVAARLGSDIIPDGNRTRNLGSDTARFANIYTGDLHLRNERGDYTLIEEEDCLTIRFNKNGKRYRFLLERAPEFDET